MKKIFSFLILFSFFLSFGTVYAEDQPKTPKTIVTEKQENYKLINDTTKTISEADEKELTTELNKIFKNIAETTDKNIKIYTFIYDSPSKSVNEAEKEILSKYTLDNSIDPIIFIYNKADKTYKFIIDERIDTFISHPYTQDLTNSLLINGDLSSQNLKIFLLRFSTTTGMTIQSNITNATAKAGVADEKHFSTYDFSSVKTNKTKDIISDQTNLPKEEKSNEALYMGIALLLALISIFVVVYKKRQR